MLLEIVFPYKHSSTIPADHFLRVFAKRFYEGKMARVVVAQPTKTGIYLKLRVSPDPRMDL